jgi:hypothetical protein
MMRAENVLKTLTYSPLSNVTWLLAQERFVQFNRHESLKVYIMTSFSQGVICVVH